MRKIPQAALDIIKRFEGFREKAYICPAGVLTIGYGHTGPDVAPGMVISKDKAEELLAKDAGKFAQGIESSVKVPLTDNQFSALVSFTYNVGVGALRGSTLLRKLNKGEYSAVPSELMKWTKAGGKQITGLVNRRIAEGALWDKKEGENA